MTETTTVNEQDLYTTDKLKFGEKVGHALAEGGENLVSNFGASFALLMFTDVIGIPAALAGTLSLIATLFNIALDAVSGWLMDNTRLKLGREWKKGGRFRPFIVVATPIFVVLTIVQYATPPTASIGFKAFMIYGLMVIIDFVYDFINGAQNAVMSRMTQRPSERNALSAMKGVFVLIAAMLVLYFVPFFKGLFADERTGYLMAISLLGVLMLISEYISVAVSKERIVPPEEKQGDGPKYSFKELLGIVWNNKPFLILLLVNIATVMSDGLMNASNVYWAKYVWGDEKVMGSVGMAGGVLIIPGALIAASLAKWLGKKTTFVIGVALACVSAVLRFLVPTGNAGLLIAASLFVGLGIGLRVSIAGSLSADTIEYGELKNGKRTEGVYGALGAMVSKLSRNIGRTVVAWSLAAMAFVPNVEQTAATKTGIKALWSVGPAVLMLISSLMMLFLYPLTEEKFREVVTQIKEKQAHAE